MKGAFSTPVCARKQKNGPIGMIGACGGPGHPLFLFVCSDEDRPGDEAEREDWGRDQAVP